MTLSYRSPRYRDWRRLACLVREGFPHMTEAEVARYCSARAAETELALAGPDVCGAAIAGVDGSTAKLELLAVDRRWRDHGIDEALLARFEHRAMERGFAKIAIPSSLFSVERLSERGYQRRDRGAELEKSLAPRKNGAALAKPRRALLDGLAYRMLVTVPETGSPFFPPRGLVDTRPAATGPRWVEEVERRRVLPAAPLRINNRLPEHPLFGDARIKETIRRLPPEHVEIRAIRTIGQHGSYGRTERITDIDGLRAFELLAERPLWINLHHIQRYDPGYRELLEQYLRQLGARIDELYPEVYEAGCFLLLSSGSASVHFHADPDQSFLNQIRGGKRAHVYPSAMLPEATVETLVHSGDHDAVTWRPEYEERAYPPVHLRPGDSVLLPLFAPHRVENDDEPSVSLSIGFHTRNSYQRSRVHLVNRELRALDLPVSPYGRSPLVDRIKHGLHAGVRLRKKLSA
jgi:GNAT superfamily N-acetyltransferase